MEREQILRLLNQPVYADLSVAQTTTAGGAPNASSDRHTQQRRRRAPTVRPTCGEGMSSLHVGLVLRLPMSAATRDHVASCRLRLGSLKVLHRSAGGYSGCTKYGVTSIQPLPAAPVRRPLLA
ncbi:hypothetical protein, partial [Dactylosporangium sp. NPDC006015]|uniref:hypothetical protein n=1 Tax=Dactylosporangium sp. NPDC006015 TaxID=3154576 RepID=UPI0033A54A49